LMYQYACTVWGRSQGPHFPTFTWFLPMVDWKYFFLPIETILVSFIEIQSNIHVCTCFCVDSVPILWYVCLSSC
jgi:hypothetical protein